MIHQERVAYLNTQPPRQGDYVLYWMQASQRTEYNHALEYAIIRANELKKPLIVFFGITDSYPEANLRHYQFMLEGLQHVYSSLKKRGIQFVVKHVLPPSGAAALAEDASLVVVDRGYLSLEKEWRIKASQQIECPLIQVESNVVVPVEEASPKKEYSAATLRGKLEKCLDNYMVPLPESSPRVPSLDIDFDTFNIFDENALSHLTIDRTVESTSFKGGTLKARQYLSSFITHNLDSYAVLSNDPTKDCRSHMSPYLHFGQISPLYIALRIFTSTSPGRDAFLEQLITRRELSMNFVHYNKDYSSIKGLPSWSKKTLEEHAGDFRDYTYTLRELEHAQTHDPYWNAAQKEMVFTGKMHGYMRMYWGKKILEWTETPGRGFEIALYLNNKYELDGRDPNGYAGVAWCWGTHDRPWKERPIFGKVRYMNARGLKRKFNADEYVAKVEMYDNL